MAATLLIAALCVALCHASIDLAASRHGAARSVWKITGGNTSHGGNKRRLPVEDALTTNRFPLIWARTGISGSSYISRRDDRPVVIAAFARSSRRASESESPRSAALDIPRGGAQKSINVKTEGGNAIVALILNTLQNISPTLAAVIRTIFRIIERITGLDLVPVKVEKKSTGAGRSGRRKKSRSRSKAAEESEEEEAYDEESEEEKVEAAPKKKKKGAPKAAKPAAKKKSAGGGSSASAKKHLTKSLKANSPNYRIQRELKSFLSSPPPNLKVSVGKNIRIWIVTFNMPEDTIYAGEKYRLRIQFPSDYPAQPPSVYFMQPTPRHEHVYTNGDICLSLLGKDWRPTMTAQSLAVSIMSILSGARKKSLPMDNARQAMNKPGGKQDDWIYHDDNC